MTVVRSDNLSVSFGGTCVLKNVTLEFPNTGVVAQICPIGAGKSTLLHSMSGLASPSARACMLGALFRVGELVLATSPSGDYL